jgi:DNA-binding transcriptional LysR family regulator
MRHLRIYRAIRLIQRTGSIRKAADLLAVSPSALNRSIQAFEEELTLPVFERVTGGVRLTTAGELLLEMLDRHLTEFDDFRTRIAHLRDGLAGVLRLGLGADIASGEVLAAVREFETAHPGVSVEMIADDTTTALRRRDVDLAILVNPQTDDRVEVVQSHRVALVAWTLPGPSGEGAAPQGLWDLMEGRVLLPPDDTGARRMIGHILRRRRLAEGIVSAVPASMLAAQMRDGPRSCLFPATVFEADALPEGVRRLGLPLGTLEICVLRAARVPVIRPAQAFLTVLQRRLDAVLPDAPDPVSGSGSGRG